MAAPRYTTGEEVHVGDEIRHAGEPARIVAVMSRGEYSPEFSKEGWSHYEKGFLVRDAHGNVFMYEHANEDLELIGRSADSMRD